MIVQELSLGKYSWNVKVYYAISFYSTEEIIEDLLDLGCEEEDIALTLESMDEDAFDFASTHTNLLQRRTVIILGKSSSAKEFANTLAHEVGHLAAHISIADNIDPFGEEIQYLAGKITEEMFDVSERFLCEHCRKELFE